MADSGHDFVREIILKHGVDRYPVPELALIKVMEELGELSSEWLKMQRGKSDREHLAKEYGDVGLALYGLGNTLGLNLDDEMKHVVAGETRRFA